MAGRGGLQLEGRGDEHTLKVVILGDTGVGKTSMVTRLIHKTTSSSPPSPTVGLDFTLCQVLVGDKWVRVSVWDTAGQERFQSLLPVYCRGAQGVILMFDLTDLRSFHALNSFLNWAEETLPENACKLLVGNKRDLAERGRREVTSWTAQEWAEQEGADYVELSMIDSSTDNLMTVFTAFLSQMLQKDPRPLSFHPPISEQSPSKPKCCF